MTDAKSAATGANLTDEYPDHILPINRLGCAVILLTDALCAGLFSLLLWLTH